MSLEKFEFGPFDVKCMTGETARMEILKVLNSKLDFMRAHLTRYMQIHTDYSYDTLQFDIYELMRIVDFLLVVGFISRDVHKNFEDYMNQIKKELQECI